MTKLTLAAILAILATSALASPRSDVVNTCLRENKLSGCRIATNPNTGRPAVWCADTSKLPAAQKCDDLADSTPSGAPAPRRRD